MAHNLQIVFILTVGFTLASVLAFIAQRLRLPYILGYLLAGYIIGPYSPGFVANTAIAEQLAEVGIIFMLFGVGLHFKLEDLLGVKNIATPGAIVQTFAATAATIAITYLNGWTIEAGLITGLAIGVASTVILVRALSDNRLLHTIEGHISVGWLIVEDILTVIFLVMLPMLTVFASGKNPSVMQMIGITFFSIVKFLILVVLMFTWGHKIVSHILIAVARQRSQELFTISVFALILLIAVGSSFIFGTSIALGAFIAGMVIAKTSVKYQAAADALAFKDVFTIIFFLSVGMLFDPSAIVAHFSLFISIIAIILIIKPLTAFIITQAFGYPTSVALTVGIALAQIGEFSFILVEEGTRLKLLPDEGFDLVVACALVSISLNPILFNGLDFIHSRFAAWFPNGVKSNISIKQNLLPKSIVIGFEQIGQNVLSILKEYNYESIIIDNNIDATSNPQETLSIIYGDATKPSILKEAEVERASHLFITIADEEKTLEIIHNARNINPAIKIIARVKSMTATSDMDALEVDYICSEYEDLKAYTTLVRDIL